MCQSGLVRRGKGNCDGNSKGIAYDYSNKLQEAGSGWWIGI